MFVYILLFILLFALSLSKRQELTWPLSCVIVLLFAGLRNRTVGIDTAGGYYEIFTYAQNGYGLKWLEPGWVALNRICVSLGVEYEGLLFLAAIIFVDDFIVFLLRTNTNH